MGNAFSITSVWSMPIHGNNIGRATAYVITTGTTTVWKSTRRICHPLLCLHCHLSMLAAKQDWACSHRSHMFSHRRLCSDTSGFMHLVCCVCGWEAGVFSSQGSWMRSLHSLHLFLVDKHELNMFDSQGERFYSLWCICRNTERGGWVRHHLPETVDRICLSAFASCGSWTSS